jgi:hypothetical protein
VQCFYYNLLQLLVSHSALQVNLPNQPLVLSVFAALRVFALSDRNVGLSLVVFILNMVAFVINLVCGFQEQPDFVGSCLNTYLLTDSNYI